MSESQPSSAPAAWRTIAITAFMLILLAGCFAWGVERGFNAFSAQAFGSLCLGGAAAVAAVAAKASIEHLGGGSGLKGALSALMTDAKPGDPSPEKPQ